MNNNLKRKYLNLEQDEEENESESEIDLQIVTKKRKKNKKEKKHKKDKKSKKHKKEKKHKKDKKDKLDKNKIVHQPAIPTLEDLDFDEDFQTNAAALIVEIVSTATTLISDELKHLKDYRAPEFHDQIIAKKKQLHEAALAKERKRLFPMQTLLRPKDNRMIVCYSVSALRNNIMNRLRYEEPLVVDFSVSPWEKFSPYYPHEEIPVPYSPGETSVTVEGIWQGLKVTKYEGVDISKMKTANPRTIYRNSKDVLGWAKGLAPNVPLLKQEAAFFNILFPSYKYVLDVYCQESLSILNDALEQGRKIVFLEFGASIDITNSLAINRFSFSHLVRLYLEGRYPQPLKNLTEYEKMVLREEKLREMVEEESEVEKIVLEDDLENY